MSGKGEKISMDCLRFLVQFVLVYFSLILFEFGLIECGMVCLI